MSTIAASTAAGSRISGSRSGGIVSAIGRGNPANLAALGINNQQAAGAAPELLLPGPVGESVDFFWAPVYAFLLFQT